MSISINDKEYEKLIKRLEFYDTTRNNLLTFSFTAVLTILGAALLKTDVFSEWFCLIPFCLIIPFAARISYYRLASAQINSFLKQFSPERMQFEIGNDVVGENNCRFYRSIAWLVNHEMVLFGLATTMIFYFKVYSTNTGQCYNCLILSIPIILTVTAYLISNSTYSYEDLMKSFGEKWDSYSNGK